MKKIILIILALSLILACSCKDAEQNENTTESTKESSNMGEALDPDPSVTTSTDNTPTDPDKEGENLPTPEERANAYGLLLTALINAISGNAANVGLEANYGAADSEGYSENYRYSELAKGNIAILSDNEGFEFEIVGNSGSSSSEEVENVEYIYKDGWLYSSASKAGNTTLKKTEVSPEDLGFTPSSDTTINPGEILGFLPDLSQITLFSSISVTQDENGTLLVFTDVDSDAINGFLLTLLDLASQQDGSLTEGALDTEVLSMLRTLIESGVATYDLTLTAQIDSEENIQSLSIDFALKVSEAALMGCAVSISFNDTESLQIEVPSNADEYTEYPYEEFMEDFAGLPVLG